MTKCAGGGAGFALLMGIAVGCGGTVLNDPVGSVGGSAGASGAHAGASGSIGNAGASSAGASSAGASNTAGGANLDACSEPQQPGNCDAYLPSFWHNPSTGVCEPFVYGGCGGNRNRYPTREACLAACPGGGGNWGACTLDEDCVPYSSTCCAVCEPVDINQLVVVDQAHAQDQEDLHCAAVGACAPCPPSSELDATGKYFKPVCLSGQCSIIDVRQTPLTDCMTDTDCELRSGTGCCSACDSTSFIAASKTASFCDTVNISCGLCIALTPQGLSSTCSQGKCVLTAPL